MIQKYPDTFLLDLLIKSKSLLEYTNLFSPIDYKKNDKNNDKRFSIFKKMQKLSVTATGLEHRTTQFVNEHSTILPNG